MKAPLVVTDEMAKKKLMYLEEQLNMYPEWALYYEKHKGVPDVTVCVIGTGHECYHRGIAVKHEKDQVNKHIGRYYAISRALAAVNRAVTKRWVSLETTRKVENPFKIQSDAILTEREEGILNRTKEHKSITL